uniref:Uncharacterized protein n=1 Tax=Chlorobium phaeobacteroides (strain BS1) TaxID=331678 RepID=B3EQ41_CHLPB
MIHVTATFLITLRFTSFMAFKMHSAQILGLPVDGSVTIPEWFFVL